MVQATVGSHCPDCVRAARPDAADLGEIRARSVALSELFIAEVERGFPDLVLASPREAGLRGSQVSFGEFGLKAVGRGRITARQIEAARRAITRKVKRGGKLWIRVFPDKPVTKKPAETRMGSGKGNPEFWVAVVKPGRTLFELSYPNEELARAALNKAIQKLPIKARIITREEEI